MRFIFAFLIPTIAFIGLPAVAAQSSNGWPDEFDELTYASTSQGRNCIESFKGGKVEYLQIFNKEKQRFTWITRLTGANPKNGVRIGQRLYALGLENRPYAAMVTQANDQTATVTLPREMIPFLWLSEYGSVYLFQNPDNMLSLSYKTIVFSNDQSASRRQIITRLLNCAEVLDNSE